MAQSDCTKIYLRPSDRPKTDSKEPPRLNEGIEAWSLQGYAPRNLMICPPVTRQLTKAAKDG